MEHAISVRGLCKRYTSFALKDVTFEVPKGSIVGFIGDNGAGKTTTMKSILNLIHRDAGDITIFGQDNRENEAEIKQRLGVVFDGCSFHETLRAPDVGRILRAVYRQWNDESYSGYLRRFGLPLNKPIKEYSSGMKTKLALAAALSHEARLLLLDEATSGLDPIVRSEVLELFMEFMQDEERAILISSHITSDLEKVCDYICFIHDGEIVLTEEKDLLLERFGILRCGEGQLGDYADAGILRLRRSAFGCEALLEDRIQALRRHPNAVVDRATLEDIMLLYVKGEAR